MDKPIDHDRPFFSFTGLKNDVFTIRDCFTGFQIFGGTGSGKTSGSGKFLANRFLRMNFGGLVLTVKPDECSEWVSWAKETGREEDVIIFKPANQYRFDFIRYEQKREGEGAGNTFNIVDLLMTTCEIAKPNHLSDSSSGDKFFEEAAHELVAKVIDLILLSGEAMTVANILAVINSAPTNTKKVKGQNGVEIPEVMKPIGQDGQGRRKFCRFAEIFIAASERQSAKQFSKQQERDFLACHDYFFMDYASLGDRTRSGVKMHLTTTLYQISRGELGLLFCNGEPDKDEIEISPEEAYLDKKIIIIDMPVMEWKTIGKLAQGLFKYMFQRAIERRSLKQHPHPVFIWADECQYFVGKSDQMFLTTARSSGCATVYLTQNIENYYSIMAEPVARSMLGNLQTKIFHQNSDVSTNEYARSIIGKIWEESRSSSVNFSAHSDTQANIGSSTSERQVNKIEPEQFNELRTGGLHNDFIVDGVVFSGGRRWVRTDDIYDVVEFKQDFGGS